MVQVSCVTVILVPLIVLMLWMDVALFVKVQHLPPGHDNNIVNSNSNTVNIVEPVLQQTSYVHSAFERLTMKLLMLCPPMHYIEIPLTGVFVHSTNIADYLSANGVSFVGLLFAALAARMFYSPSYKYHILGAIFFKIRDFLDSVDGEVASISRHQSTAQIPNPNSSGYLFDGVCDGLAVLFVLVGLGFSMLRESTTPGRHKTRYHQLLNIDIDDVEEKGSLPPAFTSVKIDGNLSIVWNKILAFLRRISGNQLHYIMPILVLMLAVGIQVLFSSLVWNYVVYNYYVLFDTDQIAVTTIQQFAQNAMLKAPTTWIIIYVWRLLNPHTYMEYILIAILYKRTFEFFRTIKWVGYAVVCAAGCVTYFHYQYALDTILTA